jgi:uncharacterized protein (TIGR02646 family)
MKYIKKGGRPHTYKDWCNRVRGTGEEDYRELRNPEKTDLHLNLLKEQGWLCAYTMKRVDLISSHIEHIKPETLCRAQLKGSDLYYDNLVACYPRAGMKKGYRYGAPLKDDWWENDGIEFISPLHPICEKRFRFDLRGKIAAVRSKAAVTTIDVLDLNHQSLKDERKRSIDIFIYGPTGDDPLSAAKANQAKIDICKRYSEGQFPEFCIAIRDALDEYLKILKKKALQKKYAAQKRK